MTHSTISCDRCHATIEVGRAVLTLEAGPALPWAPHPRSGRPALDLCGRCLGELLEWMSAPAEGAGLKAAG